MSTRLLASRLLVPALLASLAAPGRAEGGGSTDDPAPVLPGFVHVPAGLVLPGTTWEDYQGRHRGNERLKQQLLYEVWGKVPAFELPAFEFGKYEVTNAQWKLYLDREYRDFHKTADTDTLKSIAAKYVKFRGESVESEWKSIYALNARLLVDAWTKAGVWKAGWTMEAPPDSATESAGDLALPAGLELVVYKHRVPEHWYGWCKLANLRVGREYVDARKAFNVAFVVPQDDPFFAEFKFRDTDFGAYPIRSVSPDEMLAFAEWAGCHLPSEYEFERAGRGDNLTWQHTFGPKWNHGAQKDLFPWADSEVFPTSKGPFRVDDERAAGSESVFGARMMHGNVWEMTRTFMDLHPDVEPEPPPPSPNVNNYALIVKGGSWGDAWQLQQLSVRTGNFGESAIFTLRYQNKADTVGMRLVRHHDRPGLDLLRHSILRIAYDPGPAVWNDYVPHAFATPLMAGADEVHVVNAGPPYAFVQEQAHAIAFAPLWITELEEKERRRWESEWKVGKADRRSFRVLGILRSDVPLVGGVRLSDQEERDLRKERESYAKFMAEYKKLPEKKKQQITLPEPPPEPDAYEELTEKNAQKCGLWREKTVPPGEWLVVYWNGFLGLANKSLTMPPDVIFPFEDPRHQIDREREEPRPARLELDPATDTIRLKFWVNEQAGGRKARTPPREAHSDDWALLEVKPERWTGGQKGLKERPYSWIFQCALKVEQGSLARHNWRITKPEKDEKDD